jgi:hypothetical protein
VYGLQARRASITGSLERTHNPKVAGSNPAPATKKALGIPTCAEGLLLVVLTLVSGRGCWDSHGRMDRSDSPTPCKDVKVPFGSTSRKRLR